MTDPTPDIDLTLAKLDARNESLSNILHWAKYAIDNIRDGDLEEAIGDLESIVREAGLP